MNKENAACPFSLQFRTILSFAMSATFCQTFVILTAKEFTRLRDWWGQAIGEISVIHDQEKIEWLLRILPWNENRLHFKVRACSDTLLNEWRAALWSSPAQTELDTRQLQRSAKPLIHIKYSKIRYDSPCLYHQEYPTILNYHSGVLP